MCLLLTYILSHDKNSFKQFSLKQNNKKRDAAHEGAYVLLYVDVYILFSMIKNLLNNFFWNKNKLKKKDFFEKFERREFEKKEKKKKKNRKKKQKKTFFKKK